MENASTKHSLVSLVKEYGKKYPNPSWEIFTSFAKAYEAVLASKGLKNKDFIPLFQSFINCVLKEMNDPTGIEPFHRAMRSPIDYYALGCEIFKPIIDSASSTVKGTDTIEKIIATTKAGENAICFANHQIEADPQALSVLVDDKYGDFSEKMIFVAGERVITDVLAVPFSLGRNLLCIFSKKYFEAHAERKSEMIEHNQKTLSLLGQMLDAGGVTIYIAPSGGRDRPGEDGRVLPAPFDPSSIEMMYLLSKKARAKTRFYPLALSTHHILPPPDDLQVNLGEQRSTKCAPVHFHFGEEINMENFPGSDTTDKKEKRVRRANEIYRRVSQMYQDFPGESP